MTALPSLTSTKVMIRNKGKNKSIHICTLATVLLYGQRPIIIIPIGFHCNMPQNKTHSYASHTTHSRHQHIQQTRDRPRPCTSAAKNRGLASIQGRYPRTVFFAV